MARFSRLPLLATISALMAAALIAITGAPAVAAPLSARSYYVYKYDLTWAYNRGHDAGVADLNKAGTQTRYVVLDFGAMYQRSDGGWNVTAFSGPDLPLWKARNMVEQWAEGYYYGVGSDLQSVAHVGLGTNNSAGDVNSAAGKALANAAKHAVSDAQSGGYYSQGRPVGATLRVRVS